jgi:hypothetical protein
MPFLTPATLINGIDRYNEIVRAVADETGALFIGHENDIPGDPVHFVDAFHLTDAGSRAMAERVSRFLESSVEFLCFGMRRHRTLCFGYTQCGGK